MFIVDYFMAKDQAIPRRNKMFWHYARDDFMFTTVRVISKHQDTQVYGAILPQHLTNQAMLESEAYMTYRAYATGEKTPKPKSTKKKADSESSPKTKPTQASKGKRIKTSAKGDKAAKMKQSATKSKGLTVLSEVALSEADQMKLATKRSKKEFHSSHASGSGAGDKPEVPDVPEYRSESEEESWTFSQGEDEEENDEHDSANDNDDEDDDQENDSGETESDDDGDNFVHPNLSTYKADDQEKEKEEEKANDDDEVSSDQMVSTPPDYELTEEEENQEDDNVMVGEQEDEEMRNCTKELNISTWLEKDAEMTRCSNNQDTQRGFDSDFYPKFQSEIIPVNVSVSATTETPSSDTTIPQPPIPIIQSQQQTYDSTTTTTIPTTTLPEIPNFASLFDERCSECGYSAKIQQAQRKTAQAENDEFLKQIDSNIKAIIKDQVKAQVSKIMPKVEKSQPKSSGKSAQAKEHGPRVDDLEEPFAAKVLTQEIDDCIEYWHNPEGRPYPHDLSKPLPLIQNAREEDKSLKTRLIPFRSQKMTPYTAYHNIQGIIYQDDMDINHLMRTGKLHNQNRRDLPRDIPLDSVVVLRYEKRSKSKNKGKVSTEMELVLEQTQQEHQSDTKVFTMTMEILLDPTSNKLMEERFDTSAGNHVKEILLKLNLPDHRILKDGGEVKEFQRSFRHSDTERLSRSDEVLKLKNFKKDATLKLFKSTNQERLLVFYNCNTSNEVDVNLPTPMPKPQSPINEPSQANTPTTHSNHVSLQSQSLPLSNSCNTNVGKDSIPPQRVNQS
ncbi:hypothetical protein Tco_1294211 [Tanacetum coccineum]